MLENIYRNGQFVLEDITCYQILSSAVIEIMLNHTSGTEPRELSAIQAALIDYLRASEIKVIVNSHVREHFDSYIEDPTIALYKKLHNPTIFRDPA